LGGIIQRFSSSEPLKPREAAAERAAKRRAGRQRPAVQKYGGLVWWMKPVGRFDGFGVATQRGVVAGNVDAAVLPRLTDLLAPNEGPSDVAYRITGSADALGKPALEVTLSGSVPLLCQRCLRAFQWPVAQTTLLLLARDAGEMARLDDEDPEHEVVLADAPLDPIALVEDELLLTLPFVPRCPDLECPATRDGFATDSASRAASAFEALAALKSDARGKGSQGTK